MLGASFICKINFFVCCKIMLQFTSLFRCVGNFKSSFFTLIRSIKKNQRCKNSTLFTFYVLAVSLRVSLVSYDKNFGGSDYSIENF